MEEIGEVLRRVCHCGAVRFSYRGRPKRLVSCNCSICRRLRALWAHGDLDQIAVEGAETGTHVYTWGDGGIAFHACRTCNCTTHWAPVAPDSASWMAVNAALCEPADIEALPVRRFDGADTWEFLD